MLGLFLSLIFLGVATYYHRRWKKCEEKLENLTKNMSDIGSDNKEQISTILNNLSDGSKAFSESAKRMNNILDGVENGEGNLGKLVNSNDLVNNMDGFIDDLRLLLEDFSENTEEYLKKYIRANKKVKKEK